MAWVLLEVLVAFGIAVFIVWWTFPKEKKSSPVSPPPTRDESGSEPKP